MILIFLLVLKLNSQPFTDRNLNINMSRNNYDTKFYLSYSFKFSSVYDFIYFYKIPFIAYSDIKKFDIKDFKLKYYGFSIHPFRYLITNKKIRFDNNQPVNNTTSNNADNSKAGYKKLLSPLYLDIKENMDFYLIDLSMKNISPQWNSLNSDEKKSFIKDVYIFKENFVR